MSMISDAWMDRFARHGAPARTLSYLIRPALIAPPGRWLVWGDWSSIEARTLPWLAGSPAADKVLDVFRENDKDQDAPDIYMLEASNIYQKPAADVAKDERQVGKVATLALGFGGSVGALSAMATGYGIHLGEDMKAHIVGSWRENNGWAVHFWADLRDTPEWCMQNPGSPRHVGRLVYVFEPDYLGGTLFCCMPCGTLLSYPALRWQEFEREDGNGETYKQWSLTYLKGYERKKLWHGILAENPTQGAAASILRGTMRRIERDENAPGLIVAHTHDEIVCETGDTDDAIHEARRYLRDQMVRGFDWSEGLPLAADVSDNEWYSKAV